MRRAVIVLGACGVALACSGNDVRDSRSASRQTDGGGVSGADASSQGGTAAASGGRNGSGGTAPLSPLDAHSSAGGADFNAGGGASNTHDASQGGHEAPDASLGQDAGVGSGGRDAGESPREAAAASGGRPDSGGANTGSGASPGIASVLCGKQNLALFDPPAPGWQPARGMCAAAADCPAGYACVGTVCTETACSPGATGCSLAGVVTCAADGRSFGSVVPCPARSTCVAKPGGAECVPWCCDAGGGTCWGKYSFQCFDGLSSPMTSMCSGPQPLCNDRSRDGDESDTDCGGSCDPCVDGQRCGRDADCTSGWCRSGECVSAPAPGCPDGETLCDGACTPGSVLHGCLAAGCDTAPCPSPAHSHPYCDSNQHRCGFVCDPDAFRFGDSCLPLPPVGDCQDGIKNGTETDVDCGGDACPNCPRGASCVADSDCYEGCTAGKCDSISLYDGVKDGRETDVDCGGGGLKCAVGLRCRTAEDCSQPSLCVEGFCRVASSCSNGIFDGSETSTDCGGPCPPCSDHSTCRVNADCQSQHCAPDGPYFSRPGNTEYYMNTCHAPCPSSGDCEWTCPGYAFLMLLNATCCREDGLCGCGSAPNGVFNPATCTY